MKTASMSVRPITKPMEDQVKFLASKYFGDIWYFVQHVEHGGCHFNPHKRKKVLSNLKV